MANVATNIRIGTTLVGIDGPGQSPTMTGAAAAGRVVKFEITRWGFSLEVRMEDGTTEFTSHVHAPEDSRNQIGWHLPQDLDQDWQKYAEQDGEDQMAMRRRSS